VHSLAWRFGDVRHSWIVNTCRVRDVIIQEGNFNYLQSTDLPFVGVRTKVINTIN
jgi:hypothetical protein